MPCDAKPPLQLCKRQTDARQRVQNVDQHGNRLPPSECIEWLRQPIKRWAERVPMDANRNLNTALDDEFCHRLVYVG